MRSHFSHNLADCYKHRWQSPWACSSKWVWYLAINRPALQILSDKATEIAFQCLMTCSNFVTVGHTECSLLSQRSARYVRKRVGYWPHSLSELVWDSKIEGAGASSDCIIYLSNNILGILNSWHIPVSVTLSLKELGKTTWEFLIPHSEKHTGNDKTCRYSGTALNNR